MTDKEKESAQAGENRKKGVSWFQVIVLMLMIIIILLLLRQCQREEPDDGLEASVKAELGQLDGKSEEEIQAELDRVVGEGMFHIAINTSPVFADGAAEGNLEIENVPNNRYSMIVRITLDDTGEMVYDSGLIDPNYHIQRDKLNKELEAGEYPATAAFYAYDPETMQEAGSTACEITLIVLN